MIIAVDFDGTLQFPDKSPNIKTFILMTKTSDEGVFFHIKGYTNLSWKTHS